VFEQLLQHNCIERILGERASKSELEQLVVMPVIAHVQFFIQLLKFATENEKKVLIDKICLMTKDH
jgi:hypothetical protein